MNKYISTFEIGESEYKLKDSEVRTDLGTHEGNTDIHVTAAEKEYWNSKVNPPSYSAPTAKQLTYTGEAQDLLNPGSSTSGSIQYSTDEVNWSTTIPQGTNAGTYTVYWKFAGSEIVYVDSTAINVTIAKANPTYTAPTAKTLTYNGNALDLINVGTTNNGTFKYGFDPEQCIEPINANGHEYVEIGGLRFATMNVGADSVTDYGLYFQWGDTQGYTAELIGSGSGQKYFGWLDYKYGDGTSSPSYGRLSKYNSSDGKTVLELSDDAVRANWGGGWRTPTYNELYITLAENTNKLWTTNYLDSGVGGVILTDKTDSSKVLFFPYAGRCYDGQVKNTIDYGYYQMSNLSNPNSQNLLFLQNNTYGTNVFYRYYGLLVRGIIDSTLPQGTNADTYTVYWKLEGDENHNDVTGTVEVTIAKVTPTVTAPTAKTGLVYTGSAQELVNSGSTDFGILQYSLDNETYGTSVPSGTNAGSYTVYYKVVGNNNINDVAVLSVSCSIGKANRTVTISGNQTDMTSGQSNTITVTATGSPASSLISVTSSNTAVATVSGTTVNAIGAGTTTVTATVASDANYNSGNISYSLSVAWGNGVYAAYADGSLRTAENADTNAIGVAVLSDNCKFIIDKTNNTTAAWDSNTFKNNLIAGCFATDDSSTAKTNYTGVSNTNAIAAVATGGEAAKYCRSCSKTIAGKTVYGYLGAAGEWLTAYNNKTTVASIMSTIGGTTLSDVCIWTSTLRYGNTNSAWYFNWVGGDVSGLSKKNGASGRVRPFYEIS